MHIFLNVSISLSLYLSIYLSIYLSLASYLGALIFAARQRGGLREARNMSLLQCPEFPQAIPQKGGPPVTIQSLHLAEKMLYFEWSPPWHFKAYILTFELTFYLTFYLTSILTFYLTSILTFYLAFSPTSILTFYLAFSPTFSSAGELDQKGKREKSREGEKLLFASGGEHCDLALAVEVRQGTLWSWACCSGPAGNTARNTLILSLLFGSGRGTLRSSCACSWGPAEEAEDEAGQLTQNLTTLTWQVGKKEAYSSPQKMEV